MDLSKIRKGLSKFYSKDYLSMCTGALTFVTPIGAAIEKSSGMTDPVSLKTRLTTAAVFYLGLGKLVELRDYSINRIEKKSGKELKGWGKWGHDSLFSVGVSLIVRTPIYLSSGETDWKKIGWAVAGNTIFTMAAGGFIAYLGDLYREILNPEREEKRVPNFMKNKSYNMKRNLLIGLTAASLTLTGLVYYFTPNGEQEKGQEQSSSYIMPKGDEKTMYLEQRMS
tara:strand:- start:2551 stop:3225 length:675 start_codon:yes stop_codon:yes gene_type:complete